MEQASNIIERHLLKLLEDYNDFNSESIQTQAVPDSAQFAQQVSKAYPAIYRAYEKVVDQHGKVNVWTDPSLLESPAFSWSKQDLVDLVREKVDIAITPNGRADDLHTVSVEGHDEAVFLSPATVRLTIGALLERLDAADCHSTNAEDRDRNSSPVHYLQSQNSNLTTTPLAPVLKHIPDNFPFAEPVLRQPDAVNIWIGDERSITSTHRDPYENLYLVIKGSKTFTLFPPVDEITLPTRLVRTGEWTYNEQAESFEPRLASSTDPSTDTRIPWISIDPLLPKDNFIAEYPLYANASPRTVTVHEGEILYLPSGWYHHVQQACGVWDEDGSRAPCIAVNYWYDMEYSGEKYVMRQLLGRLVAELHDQGKETD